MIVSLDPYFTRLDASPGVPGGRRRLALVTDGQPPSECLNAALDLQRRLETEIHFNHNFGLTGDHLAMVIGKMFGVLTVETPSRETGYLSAFSGKLAGKNHHPGFVPPVFDSLADDSFLNEGMRELDALSFQIRQLESDQPGSLDAGELRKRRRDHSIALQAQLFEQYHFLNQYGEHRSLTSIFADAGYRQPVSGAGECAGPKLLHYAFRHGYRPIALAEFWWGLSPKSATWKHRHFYPLCKEKCEPIMVHMLMGLR